MKVFSIVMI